MKHLILPLLSSALLLASCGKPSISTPAPVTPLTALSGTVVEPSATATGAFTTTAWTGGPGTVALTDGATAYQTAELAASAHPERPARQRPRPVRDRHGHRVHHHPRGE